MQINFSPVRSDKELALSVSGDVLTVNGEVFDFSFVGEGDVLPQDAIASEWIMSDVTRVAGIIQVTVLMPHGPDAPDQIRYPEAIELNGEWQPLVGEEAQ